MSNPSPVTVEETRWLEKYAQTHPDAIVVVVGDETGELARALGSIPLGGESLDLLILAGDHTFNGTMTDLQGWMPRVKLKGLAFIHGYYQHDEVRGAWLQWWKRGNRMGQWAKKESIPSSLVVMRVK